MNALAKLKRKWKVELYASLREIDYCEWPTGCGSRFGLAAAHRKKQRFILDREEYMKAAMLCGRHHAMLDEGKGEDVHSRMFDKITEIIKKRNI